MGQIYARETISLYHFFKLTPNILAKTEDLSFNSLQINGFNDFSFGIKLSFNLKGIIINF